MDKKEKKEWKIDTTCQGWSALKGDNRQNGLEQLKEG